MKEEEILVNLGLSQREAIAYLGLLKLKEATALELSKLTNEQRTNTYDTLESLHKKGLVSYVLKGNRRIYLPNNPNNLHDFIKEKEKDLISILPQLSQFHNPKKERPVIEVYEGIEGMRIVLNQSLKEYISSKKEILALGAQQQECRRLDPEFHKRFYDKKISIKNKTRILITEDVKPISHSTISVRILSKGYKSPVATYIYGNKVSFWIFLIIPTIIVIESKELAESYRNYFELLWKIAKK